MPTLPVLLVCGAAGGLLFAWLRLPGGIMTGAMLAVIVCNSVTDLPPVEVPRPLQIAVYIGLGVIIGNMYRPGMLAAVRDTWPVLAGATGIVLLGGFVSAWLVYKTGLLSPGGSYLATTPGGLNVVAGLALDMDAKEAPIVLVYHLVRVYAILLSAPYVGKLLHLLVK